MRANDTALILGIVVLLATAGAEGHLCPTDSAGIEKRSETSIRITADSWLVHADDHPTCHGNGGDLAVTARLIPTICESGRVGSHTSVSTQTDCDGLAQDLYMTTGMFKFADHDIGTAESSAVTLAGPPPPPPPPEDQAPCPCTECPCSPLIVDLASNGFQFSSSEEGALFGLSGPLRMYWVGWPLYDDDRWLAMDRNGNGRIDDASELFGTATRLAAGGLARHGYEALGELDQNGDGQIDAQDSAYGSLLLWGDANRNGLSEPLELATLSAMNVESLSVNFHESKKTDEWGNRFALRSHAKAVSPPRTLKVSDVFPVCRSAP